MGFSWQRSLPKVHFYSLENWFKHYSRKHSQSNLKNGLVYLFADEFTNYNDVEIGKKTILLLNELGYGIKIPKNLSSGRSFISKGMLVQAKEIANQNILILQEIIQSDTPLIGIEPSAILSFRDEIPNLVDEKLRDIANQIKPNCLLIDEFIAKEIKAKRITKDLFTKEEKSILLHGHCHQKAIAGLSTTRICLSFPENYLVELMPTGCCGMAGSFGYEKEKFDLSNKIANLVLFPKILESNGTKIIASNGTSCRHQIKDGIEYEAFHTAEILYEALLNKKIQL